MKFGLYNTTTELKYLFREERNPRIVTRIKAVYLAMMNRTTIKIACLLGYVERIVQDWIYAYNS